MTPLDMLVDARRRIHDHGWRQGPRGDDQRAPCCLFQAIDPNGDGSIRNAGVAVAFLHVAIAGFGWPDDEHFTIVKWNDAPGRGIEQVYAVLDAAIEKAMAA